ncbi:RING-type domain-containing protein [Caenorhabditis elegans]|uniref:RING-type domain-containing protein n=1 Tax=Caenorhabditis elegans TaxID=6239 RepID=O18012_CAEEL|nr:RING-type domain-containing protein [Caenorhabditis elegans]CAB03269.2 RING-type domain-containing protein [Caenorhabditis elegans]|eukprot:NP_506726.2 Uncharacterized protein CELE_T01G5.7 [Caenorhabditis elegans]
MRTLAFIENFISTVPFAMGQSMTKLKKGLEGQSNLISKLMKKHEANIPFIEDTMATDIEKVLETNQKLQLAFAELDEQSEKINSLETQQHKLVAELSKMEIERSNSAIEIMKKDKQLRTTEEQLIMMANLGEELGNDAKRYRSELESAHEELYQTYTIFDKEKSDLCELIEEQTKKLTESNAKQESRKECPICCWNYDNEDRLPRVMDCGHTMCHTCIISTINESDTEPICPFDREPMFGPITLGPLDPYQLPQNRCIME